MNCVLNFQSWNIYRQAIIWNLFPLEIDCWFQPIFELKISYTHNLDPPSPPVEDPKILDFTWFHIYTSSSSSSSPSFQITLQMILQCTYLVLKSDNRCHNFSNLILNRFEIRCNLTWESYYTKQCSKPELQVLTYAFNIQGF